MKFMIKQQLLFDGPLFPSHLMGTFNVNSKYKIIKLYKNYLHAD